MLFVRRTAPPVDLESLGEAAVLRRATADVAVAREAARRRRLTKLALVLSPLATWLWARLVSGRPVRLGVPDLPLPPELVPGLLLTVALVAVLAVPMVGAGRSPHVLFRPSEIDTRLEDVKGCGVVVEEVVKTMNLFLHHRTFKERMGGTSRRAVLFEGPPGTGKTYLAKAMAAEAGVPFLFVSSSAFQSMYYGQTNRKIRSYFKALRRHARREGGAIGFIEEIDAVGAARSGMGASTHREGISGVVNELLVQLQSFDQPAPAGRLWGWLVDQLNRWLPARSQLRKPVTAPANVLVVGATNRALDLDPALLRPGRFDRSIHFDLPNRSGRREIIDYYLDRKAHEPALDEAKARDSLAAMTFGYSPVMIEHLLDEALVWALRRGAQRLGWDDVQQARMTEELGLKNPVDYAELERKAIATHEAGHAAVAHLVGRGRKLEVLSIIKRGSALGLVSHSELEERYTKSRSELESLIQIAFGGMVAEELFLGESGTGPAGDLQAATALAAQMVGSLGLGGSLISYEAATGAPGANLVDKVLSGDGAREAVESILATAKAEAEQMLGRNRHLVEALATALLERDELVGYEIGEVIANAEQAVIDLRQLAAEA